MTPTIRLGISRCLLGEEVRYDGGHKRNSFLADVLGRYVEWISICPEVEAGLGTPREAMRLVGDSSHPRLLTIKSGTDYTEALEAMARDRIQSLRSLDLAGYVFKKDSPSCGIGRVRVWDRHGVMSRNGVGIFARAFTQQFPLVPIEDEGRLCDPALRDHFIVRVFCYQRWRELAHETTTLRHIVTFHAAHKYLLMAHSRDVCQALGRLVAQANRYRSTELVDRYGALLMKALAVKTTRRKQVNVLQHLVGHLEDQLKRVERMELDDVITDYHRGIVPLIVPVTLIKHYVTRYDIAYLRDQVYFDPHPQELGLRNYV